MDWIGAAGDFGCAGHPAVDLAGFACGRNRPARAAALAQSRFVTLPFAGADGVELHYFADEADDGDETAFVLLHGFLLNANSWNEVFDFFDARGRALAYDQLGYGLSQKMTYGDWTGDNPYTIDSAVTMLFASWTPRASTARSWWATPPVDRWRWPPPWPPPSADGLILVDPQVMDRRRCRVCSSICPRCAVLASLWGERLVATSGCCARPTSTTAASPPNESNFPPSTPVSTTGTLRSGLSSAQRRLPGTGRSPDSTARPARACPQRRGGQPRPRRRQPPPGRRTAQCRAGGVAVLWAFAAGRVPTGI
ncbi:MAG: hypothetical protein R2856_13645 [Caldilineaceae bacterium]